MQNNNQHLIILDLDGTLLQDFSTYDEETFSYLRKLSSEGHIIMLATGRPFRSSYFVYQALNLKTPLINYNGARVTNPSDPTYPITDLRIDRDDLLDIVDHVKPKAVFCEIIDDIFVQNYDAGIHPFLHVDGGKLHIGDLKDVLTGNPNGALFFLDPSQVQAFQDYIAHDYHGLLYSRYWGVGNYHIVEIYNPLVDKRKALQEAMHYYHIPKERCIAIGDGHNDIGLIEEAGIGVAMRNSHPDLLKKANFVTDDCFHQGVLNFLKNYFEKK